MAECCSLILCWKAPWSKVNWSMKPYRIIIQVKFKIETCKYSFLKEQAEVGAGVVPRWWRNRMERSLSPLQIHQKINWMLSKFHKTTSECWQRTPGTRKAVHSIQKEVGHNIKDKKRDTRVSGWDPSQGGSREGGKVSKHQETLSAVGLWGALESQKATYPDGGKIKHTNSKNACLTALPMKAQTLASVTSK